MRRRLAAAIDSTLLRPEARPDEVAALCREAVELQVAAVCVQPVYVEVAAKALAGSGVELATVVGFPLGANVTAVKVAEARHAVASGATELDMVLALGWFKAGEDRRVEDDIRAVVEGVEGRTVKVILETGYLSPDEIRRACLLAQAAGAHFVKTSTGFGPAGARVEDVVLMRETVGPEMGVKAAGGIRDRAAALRMLEAGANRLGTSSARAILLEG
ncbi:deoxyribose-phosphate aldolase [Limnochorda pilosa]|uniref:Deoxyribose-phosphate aldolase n=1 Tax=Limnochorda pilosa TaxID=1555112 RepID=A0A0K2SJ67_LIMPI|nr:deoxyribose-phosphate aldolase [Limnochorda pilosa]